VAKLVERLIKRVKRETDETIKLFRTRNVTLTLRAPRVAFARAMGSLPSFRNLMSAYVQAFLEQAMVSVACNGAHSLKQRLARWLLMMPDRGDDDALEITQSPLAETLGVQRPTITNVARELEHGGLILRGRGKSRFSIARAC
jgi:CRP-like cAMP-binding protein